MVYNFCDNAIKYNKDNGTVDIIISSLSNKVNKKYYYIIYTEIL